MKIKYAYAALSGALSGLLLLSIFENLSARPIAEKPSIKSNINNPLQAPPIAALVYKNAFDDQMFASIWNKFELAFKQVPAFMAFCLLSKAFVFEIVMWLAGAF